jgi:beta-N-acetylglucosaminidase
MGITIKDRNTGYERTIYDSGFSDVSKAISGANKIIREKFGGSEQIELVRDHKRRRN